MSIIRCLLIAVVGLFVTACDDASSVSDMAMCEAHAAPNTPTSCGPNTCPAGMYCLEEHPGMCAPDLAPPPDGGGVGGPGGPCINYRCVSFPATCDCHAACRSVEGSGEVGCSLNGPTLRCDYV